MYVCVQRIACACLSTAITGYEALLGMEGNICRGGHFSHSQGCVVCLRLCTLRATFAVEPTLQQWLHCTSHFRSFTLVFFSPRHTCGTLRLPVFFQLLLLPTPRCMGWREKEGWWPLCVRPLVPGESPAVGSSADEVQEMCCWWTTLAQPFTLYCGTFLSDCGTFPSDPSVRTSAQSLAAEGAGSILSLPSALVLRSVSLLPEWPPMHTLHSASLLSCLLACSS